MLEQRGCIDCGCLYYADHYDDAECPKCGNSVTQKDEEDYKGPDDMS